MRNLLDIEVQTLSANRDLSNGLQLDKINTELTSLNQVGKKTLKVQYKLGKLAIKSHDYFKSQGSEILEESGVFWTVDDFAQKMFGWKKSNFNRMKRLGNLSETKVTEFIETCQELREQGETPIVSVKSCLEFANNTNNEASERVPIREPEEKLLTLTMGNKKVSITDVQIKTNFNESDLEQLKVYFTQVAEYLSN